MHIDSYEVVHTYCCDQSTVDMIIGAACIVSLFASDMYWHWFLSDTEILKSLTNTNLHANP